MKKGIVMCGRIFRGIFTSYAMKYKGWRIFITPDFEKVFGVKGEAILECPYINVFRIIDGFEQVETG